MDSFPFAPFVYTYNATIVLIFGIRSLRTWRVSRNRFSWFFIWVGLGAAAAFYLYGIPTLLWPERAALHGFLFLLSYFPLFFGVNFALLFALEAKGLAFLKRIAAFGVPLLAVLLFFANLSSVPEPRILTGGLISWGMTFPYDILLSVMVCLVTVLPGILLLSIHAESTQAFLKKIFLASALIGGGIAGSAIALFDEYPVVLFWLFLAQFIALSFLGSIVFLDMLKKGE
ncbi:MAG: hypothetical protein Q8P12_01945 [bacterium]|nr:hypothetical protein [bacterium]